MKWWDWQPSTEWGVNCLLLEILCGHVLCTESNCSVLIASQICFMWLFLPHLTLHRVSKNCANLFLSELGQMYTNFDNIWQKGGKEARIIRVHSFSTSPNSRHHPTVLNADVPNCYRTLKVICNKLCAGLLTRPQHSETETETKTRDCETEIETKHVLWDRDQKLWDRDQFG